MSEPSADVLRRVYPRVLARTLAFTRSLPDAEDAVQEAALRALSTWPRRGTPDAPEAWLATVAANVHRDRLRKGKWEEGAGEDALETLAQASPWVRVAVGDPAVARGWKDELLRLLFACCHPCLETGESAALCLSTVVGLSTRQVALAFLAEPRTMEQRLTRARRRLRERGDPEGAAPERSLDRLDAVLRVLHLLFNEGYWSSDDASPIRADLCRLAVGLSYSLVDAFPDEPEALGLHALLLFHDARREARLGRDGTPLPLPERTAGGGTARPSPRPPRRSTGRSNGRAPARTRSRPRSRRSTAKRRAPKTRTGRRSPRSTRFSRTSDRRRPCASTEPSPWRARRARRRGWRCSTRAAPSPGIPTFTWYGGRCWRR